MHARKVLSSPHHKANSQAIEFTVVVTLLGMSANRKELRRDLSTTDKSSQTNHMLCQQIFIKPFMCLHAVLSLMNYFRPEGHLLNSNLR